MTEESLKNQIRNGLARLSRGKKFYMRSEAREFENELWELRCLNRPISQNKYLYAEADPVNKIDPSGYAALVSTLGSMSVMNGMSGIFLGHVTPGTGSKDFAIGFDGAGGDRGLSTNQLLYSLVENEFQGQVYNGGLLFNEFSIAL